MIKIKKEIKLRAFEDNIEIVAGMPTFEQIINVLKTGILMSLKFFDSDFAKTIKAHELSTDMNKPKLIIGVNTALDELESLIDIINVQKEIIKNLESFTDKQLLDKQIILALMNHSLLVEILYNLKYLETKHILNAVNNSHKGQLSANSQQEANAVLWLYVDAKIDEFIKMPEYKTDLNYKDYDPLALDLLKDMFYYCKKKELKQFNSKDDFNNWVDSLKDVKTNKNYKIILKKIKDKLNNNKT